MRVLAYAPAGVLRAGTAVRLPAAVLL